MEETERRCYYDLLGVDKKASADEIKLSFRKLAIKHHPDKAPLDKQVEATAFFQKLNEAYQVLSDSNERAWYDSHREQFLHPEFHRDEYTGFNFDIKSFCSEACYKKGSAAETEENYFKVYTDIFMKIKIEEETARKNQDMYETVSYLTAPNFGDAQSELDAVDKFYEYWENFVSCKDFAWADPFDIRECDNRRLKREVDKENKRQRQLAKKQYMSLLKQLVQFVKSKDERMTRITAQKKQEKIEKENQRKEELKKQQEEWKAKKDELLRQELLRYEEEERQRQLYLEELAKEEAERAKNKPPVEHVSDDEPETYECLICYKVFKSEGQLKNHEGSRDHLKKKKALLKEVLVAGEGEHLDTVIEELESMKVKDKPDSGQGQKKKKKKKGNPQL